MKAAFLREARVMSSPELSVIVTIYDMLQHETMTCIVMEFVQGTPSKMPYPRTGWGRSRAVDRIREALGAAHLAKLEL